MVYFWPDLPLIYTVWSYFAMINAEFVYQTDPAFFMFMKVKYLVSL